MNFLNSLDWHSDDGINRAMINDFMRNQFYDAVLREHVQDRHCVDIGFGTGLLSMLALKHGAQSVIAYESDPSRFELGQFIIRSLSLEDRITLRHERYCFQDQAADSVIFSETVNGGLWGESLWNSLPRTQGTVFLPGQYRCEIMAATVPDSFVHEVVEATDDRDCFAPGVDIDNDFVSLINLVGFKKNVTQKHSPRPGIHRLSTGQSTVHGYIPWQRIAMHAAQCVAQYQIDVSTQVLTIQDGTGSQHHNIDWETKDVTITVNAEPYRNHNVLLVPRMKLIQGKHQLTLDVGHWGPAEIPVLAVRPTDNITVTHNTRNGGLVYNYRGGLSFNFN